ncbi:MAG: serine/threonine protein kinase [Deltaproteobacteria bacterium]|nr:serine/threonine protein kinase [Deltaproteobacteria bacterium]
MERLGNYDILARVAMGGMAEIFRARQRSEAGFEKDVIIKRILPHYTDDVDFLRMFQDEAVVAAKLNHPNIVQVFDFKCVDGIFFIAMELVEGVDLKRLMQLGEKAGKPLGPNRAVQIAIGMARGLGHAHERVVDGQPLKIVHRDVSPHNVLVSQQGDVKVMDFGIAKAAARAVKTGTGVIKGKITYMSPEHAMGLELDHRTDIYATGIVLWEMLTGRRMFNVADNEMATLRAVQKGDAPKIRELCPDILPELEAIVNKLLALDRDARYQRMREAERELSHVLYKLGGADREPLEDYFAEVVPDDVRESLRGQPLREPTRDLSLDTQPAGAATEMLTSGGTVDLSDDSATKSDVSRKPKPPPEPTIMLPGGVPLPARRGRWIAPAIGVIAALALAFWWLSPSAPPEAPVQVNLNEAPPPSSAPVVAPAVVPPPPPAQETKAAEPRPVVKKPEPVKKDTPIAGGPKSFLEINCPEGATVLAEKTVLGVLTAKNRESFAIPAGTHMISVRSPDGRTIGGPTKVSVEAGELDKFACKKP